MVSEPCPDSGRVDEFGVGLNQFSSCAVLHLSSSEETKTKEFIVRDSAYAFYNRGKGQIIGNGDWFGGMGSRVSKIEIDSVKIK